jgi:hypothetical protein
MGDESREVIIIVKHERWIGNLLLFNMLVLLLGCPTSTVVEKSAEIERLQMNE